MSATARVYQINYLRCIFCGLCIEACPTRSLTMSNDFELADDNRQDLIFTKEQLMAPLLPGMEAPPHAMRLGATRRTTTWPPPSAGRRRDASSPRPPTPSVSLGTGEAVVFWVLAPVALAGALGMVFSRNAVHSALWLVTTMLSLGVFYVVQEAPFLGAVQIIVYTGAIMILFLFVLMLVGRDSSDSVVETLRGQRVAAIVLGVGFAGLVGAGIARATQDLVATGLDDAQARQRQHPGDRRAAVHPLPAGLRGDQRAADHRGRRRDGARPHRARARQQADAEGDVAGPVPHRPAADPARPRRLRPGQLGRRPGAAARRPPGRGQLRHRHRSRRRSTRCRVPPAAPSSAAPTPPSARRTAPRGSGRDPRHYLVLAAILFTIGAVGVLVRRNAIVVFMCVELMLNSVNLTLVTFARATGTVDGQIMAFFVMVVAAAEVVVGLAIIMSIYRTRRSASVDDANLLKY